MFADGAQLLVRSMLGLEGLLIMKNGSQILSQRVVQTLALLLMI